MAILKRWWQDRWPTSRYLPVRWPDYVWGSTSGASGDFLVTDTGDFLVTDTGDNLIWM